MTGTFRSKPSASRVKASKAYQTAMNRADSYLQDRRKLGQLIEEATTKAREKGGGKLNQVWDSFTASLRLLKAYGTGRYRGASGKTLALIVAALLYFVMPADLIPDFILGLGLVDDAALLAWMLQSISTEIDQFKNWESSSAEPLDADTPQQE